jgi:DNA-binding transcriptional ArsR family regulator
VLELIKRIFGIKSEKKVETKMEEFKEEAIKSEVKEESKEKIQVPPKITEIRELKEEKKPEIEKVPTEKVIEYEKEKQILQPSQPQPIQERKTEDILTAWQIQIKQLADHPLSQVKIINSEMFYNISEILKDMNLKLNKLDDILKILKEEQERKYAISQKKEKLSTIKDKEFLNYFLNGEKYTSYELAQKLGMGRSTISFRLNRLCEQGLLEKEPIGKKIYFKLKMG